jgi:hypothetical protein
VLALKCCIMHSNEFMMHDSSVVMPNACHGRYCCVVPGSGLCCMVVLSNAV